MRKRITSLWMVLLALAVSVNTVAQNETRKKTWDFTLGLSETTLANLAADVELGDAANWTVANYAEDGTTPIRWQNTKNVSGELMANGEVIPELKELQFTTAGQSSGNNFQLSTNAFRMTRGNMEVTFPELVAGQTVTVIVRNPNGSSERGITMKDESKIERIEGPSTGLQWGADGEVTHVFRVKEGIEGTVDMTLKVLNGGVDFKLFMIDNGDVLVREDWKVAYLWSEKANYDVNNDPIVALLNEKGSLQTIDVTAFTEANTDTINALESTYDLLVISETIGSSHAFAKSIGTMVNRVPMLNLKSFMYKVWGWGTGNNQKPGTGTIVLTEAGAAHALFAELGYEAGDELEFVENGGEGNIIQGYSANEGSLIAGDDVLATVGEYNAIHLHGTQNTYMLFGLSSDAVVAGATLTDDAIDFLTGVVDYLAATKSDVRAATKPAIKSEYKHKETVVTITSSLKGASIYYTLDNTDPTEASTLYTAPFSLTEGTWVKAVTVLQGYNMSAVTADSIIIKEQVATPTVTVADGEGNTKVLSVSATEGTVYYTVSGGTVTAYTEPITFSRNATVEVWAVEDGKIDSEIVTNEIVIAGFVNRFNLLAETTFGEESWAWEQDGSTVVKGEFWAKYDYYTYNEDSTVVTPNEYQYHDFNNGWKIGTAGQRVYFQRTNVALQGTNYGPETEADGGASNFDLSFLQTMRADDPHTALLQTTVPYEGPFDVYVWLCSQVRNAGEANGEEKLEVAVSANGETDWRVLDTIVIPNDKLIRKRIAYNDEKGAVYLRLKAAGKGTTNTKILLFDVKIYGEGGEVDPNAVELPAAITEVVDIQIYNLSGVQLNELGQGLNIVRKVYSDGTVKIEKVMNK